MKNEAIKLLWARERIAALLVSGEKDAAIALAKASNLICEGAAFVAWDEAEQVPVATEEIYQPSFETLLCAEYSFRSTRRHAYGILPGLESGAGEQARRATEVDAVRSALALIRAEVAELIIEWLLAEPAQFLTRKLLVIKFLHDISDGSPTEADRIRMSRDFIDQHLSVTPELHEKAHRSIDAWEAKQTA